ncbi:MAG: rhamnogalacturonan acetylesterase [Chitinophagaceae bacterium]|nr:rhamnogalacturonan acetylesterase [Chitinophagaceae bacterium]
MIKLIVYIIFAWHWIAFLPDHQKIKIYLAGDSTMSIKDISTYPEHGWGMPFVYFWDSSVTVVNKAKNGRSTRTFKEEGLWKSITDNLSEGDYVFIQFGHNDEVIEKKSFTPPDSFASNLRTFVKDVRLKKATPVLLTPVARRKFDENLKPVDTHESYAAIVKTIAAEQRVQLIDLNTLSLRMYEEMGADKSALLFVQLKPGEHPYYPKGKMDNTHFNELGARMVAQLVLEQIRLKMPDLAERIYKP